MGLGRIVRQKSHYIMRLETYRPQKQPTNFSEEAFFYLIFVMGRAFYASVKFLIGDMGSEF